jgi:lysine 2,3-aminomutase
MEYTVARLAKEGREFIELAGSSSSLEVVRERLFNRVTRYQFDIFDEKKTPPVNSLIRVRDCARAMRSILRPQSDRLAGFSVAKAFFDIASGKNRPDLHPGFYAEIIHLVMGMQGRGPGSAPADFVRKDHYSGRKAALARSVILDRIWRRVRSRIDEYEHGLNPEIVKYRNKRRAAILAALEGTKADWEDWRWQTKRTVKRLDLLEQLVGLSESERKNIKDALDARLPFGVTPYYLSLMNSRPSKNDCSVRAQVFPPSKYVEEMSANRGRQECAFDFMLEQDTSPINLVTRRYPAIAILKPYNTCPQICVYCQRNWEIESAMDKNALAPSAKIDRALRWIAKHPAINELLITGGDPLALNDRTIDGILEKVSRIRTIEHIRIGSRILATIPMRVTDRLVGIMEKYIEPGQRDLVVVTHIEHPYEVTPEIAKAVQKLRGAGISVFNQQVFTFYNSRRFESTALRMILRKIGIEPYYIFNTKGKEETADYRVPIARLLQEVSEEARLLPGLSRTDEPVYNVPGLGKNYLRARQHRDLVSILPDGSRVYEFHPWDRNLVQQKNYVGFDVPILDYLKRLEAIGEDPADYETIWYYF